MKAVSFKSIMISLAICLVFWYAILCYGCSDPTSLRQWQPKTSMKYETKPCCESMTTDWEITCCTGDVDPADPMEDEHAYTYNNSDHID